MLHAATVFALITACGGLLLEPQPKSIKAKGADAQPHVTPMTNEDFDAKTVSRTAITTARHRRILERWQQQIKDLNTTHRVESIAGQRVEISDSSENTLPPGCDYASYTIDLTKKYDMCVVGAGLSGTVFAERAANELNETVLIIDSRPHIAGNCYDFKDPKTGVIRNQYGSHLFHTNIDRVWNYITKPKAPPWKSWYHQKLGVVNETLVPIPPNIMTINRLFDQNIKTQEEVESWLKAHQVPCSKDGCQNSEEMAISRVGEELYKAIFETYTIKQWGKSPREMDAEVTARIPVYSDFDPRYFKDKYQALPKHGYTAWFETMLKHPLIDVVLSVNFFDHRSHLEESCGKIIYTGPIDQYFEASGKEKLEYRSIKFTEFRYYDNPGYVLPTPVVNYPGPETPYTRAVEYKHYLHRPSNHSIVVKETSTDHGEPYYPVPTPRNRKLYEEYKKLAEELERTGKILFVGRLANYKYFNMDEAIDNALELFEKHALDRPGAGSKFSGKGWTNLFRGQRFQDYKLRVDRQMSQFRDTRNMAECNGSYAGGLSTPFYQGEFGMELRVMVPWAYYKSRRCRISTQGVVGTRYMYFFSPNHTVVKKDRDFHAASELPAGNPFNSGTVHMKDFPYDTEWMAPPFKAFFSYPEVQKILAGKPLLVIQNKYYKQWPSDTEPVNFLSWKVLDHALEYLVQKYTVVYRRDTLDPHYHEVGVQPEHLREKGKMRAKYPSVVFFEELVDDFQDPEDFNLLLFGLMASADRFLTVQGGTAVVSSYFGGKNLILIKKGFELEKGDYHYFKRFSNASVRWTKSDDDLLRMVKEDM